MASFARSALRFTAVTRPCVARAAFPRVRTFSQSVGLNGIIKKFTEDHEWVSLDTDTRIATIGVTEYAAKSLGDVVYVELPLVNDAVTTGEAFGAVESVKSASDIISPISGEVKEINTLLADKPGSVNRSPEGDGWIVKIELEEGGETALDTLMSEDGYKEFTTE